MKRRPQRNYLKWDHVKWFRKRDLLKKDDPLIRDVLKYTRKGEPVRMELDFIREVSERTLAKKNKQTKRK